MDLNLARDHLVRKGQSTRSGADDTARSIIGEKHAQQTTDQTHDQRAEQGGQETIDGKIDAKRAREPACQHEQQGVDHEGEEPKRKDLHR